ncbi:MAG: ABC transporter permease [Corticimicrobacter sp.]|uniref:ABC transporter permease n=1 Tax=Corticimicrobacter sp. TaxID=2678536 RepID=UPI0032DB99E2
MRNIVLIAGKEFRDGLRNRWVIAITLLLGIFALTLSFLGSAPAGAVKGSALAITVVSLSSLSIFLVPLIALLLSYDAIVGEVERGTMALLLSYPVSRGDVIIGKFAGHCLILGISTLSGYGVAGLLVQTLQGDGMDAGWGPFAVLIGSSVLLGACFLALGYLVSTVVRERATAAGLAIGVWLFFVLIYDMALLGGLVADGGRWLTPEIVTGLLLSNPADVYRLLNLSGFSSVGALSGMGDLGEHLKIGPAGLFGVLVLWVVVPFMGALLLFRRKQI